MEMNTVENVYWINEGLQFKFIAISLFWGKDVIKISNLDCTSKRLKKNKSDLNPTQTPELSSIKNNLENNDDFFGKY